MKFIDLLKMSIANLNRRRLRTSLTVLGVIIGTTSVVTMVSLGIGLDDLQTKMLKESGSLTAIDVSMNVSMDDIANQKNAKILTDGIIEDFSKIPNVKGVSPILDIDAILLQGNWRANVNIKGVNKHYMEGMNLGEGSLPKMDGKEIEYVIGNNVLTSFVNSKTNKGYYDTNTLPDVDLMNRPIFTILDTNAYYSATNKVPDNTGNTAKMPKKYLFKTAGMIAGSIDDYSQYSYGVYTDIEALKTELKKIYKNKVIPGQPQTKKGKPYKYFVYSQVVVYVDDMKNVTTVQKQIKSMGFQADSNMEWLEQSKKQSKMIQAFLGGIGAISLIVAAIGIANTMMMSIYERTKEIGIMKVLGCDMNKIRDMFLIESGIIGLLGGIIGLMISYIAAFAINKLGVAADFIGTTGDLSQIPLWLALFALVFSTIVGMLAGFFPSLRAMRLSPLAALRND